MRTAIAFIPLLLSAATPAFSAGAKDGFQSPRCPKPAQSADKAAFKRLAELPPADAFRAVFRSDSECQGRVVQAHDKLSSSPWSRR